MNFSEILDRAITGALLPIFLGVVFLIFWLITYLIEKVPDGLKLKDIPRLFSKKSLTNTFFRNLLLLDQKVHYRRLVFLVFLPLFTLIQIKVDSEEFFFNYFDYYYTTQILDFLFTSLLIVLIFNLIISYILLPIKKDLEKK